jgi:hypothetical protein
MKFSFFKWFFPLFIRAAWSSKCISISMIASKASMIYGKRANYGKRFVTRLLIGRWEKTVKKIKTFFTVLKRMRKITFLHRFSTIVHCFLV